MKPKKNEILVALLSLVLAMVLAGCGTGSANVPDEQAADGGPADAGSSHTGNYAGRVDGTDAFVDVVVDKQNHALAYLCDGEEGEKATLAEWFTGTVADDGTLDLRSEEPVDGFVGQGVGI